MFETYGFDHNTGDFTRLIDTVNSIGDSITALYYSYCSDGMIVDIKNGHTIMVQVLCDYDGRKLDPRELRRKTDNRTYEYRKLLFDQLYSDSNPQLDVIRID